MADDRKARWLEASVGSDNARVYCLVSMRVASRGSAKVYSQSSPPMTAVQMRFICTHSIKL